MHVSLQFSQISITRQPHIFLQSRPLVEVLKVMIVHSVLHCSVLHCNSFVNCQGPTLGACAGASNLLGLEASGKILELGKGASRFKVGDKVMTLLAGGG